jgi:hypothetical protein
LTIISHTHQFIFIKARKVASSSLLMALGQHCSGTDIVTAPGDTEGFPRHARNADKINTHTPPRLLQRMVTPEQWEKYTKITCVRNPWDTVVSGFLWRLSRRQSEWGTGYSQEFIRAIWNDEIDPSEPEYRSHFLKTIAYLHRNHEFFFDPLGQPVADVYLRYETLQTDFDALCERLMLPMRTLPKLKSNARRRAREYHEYYDSELRDFVGDTCKRTIEYFGYQF